MKSILYICLWSALLFQEERTLAQNRVLFVWPRVRRGRAQEKKAKRVFARETPAPRAGWGRASGSTKQQQGVPGEGKRLSEDQATVTRGVFVRGGRGLGHPAGRSVTQGSVPLYFCGENRPKPVSSSRIKQGKQAGQHSNKPGELTQQARSS